MVTQILLSQKNYCMYKVTTMIMVSGRKVFWSLEYCLITFLIEKHCMLLLFMKPTVCLEVIGWFSVMCLFAS